MKTDELQALGLSDEQVREVFRLNGKDIEAEKRKAEKVEAERDQWKTRAETAEETLKGFDGVDVAQLNKDIESWKAKAETVEKEYQAKLQERDFADALRDALSGVKFTSKAARKSITAEIKAAGLTMQNGKILGLSDLLDQMKSADASAFAAESEPPKFTTPPTSNPNSGIGFDKMTLAEKMNFANEHPTSADVVAWLKK